MHRIDAIRFGLAGGILSALIIFILTLLSTLSGYGLDALLTLKSLLPGYDIDVFGSVVGALYGFLIGFVEFFIIAFIYNILAPTPK